MHSVTILRLTTPPDPHGGVYDVPTIVGEIAGVLLAPIDVRETTDVAPRSGPITEFDLYARGQTETGLLAGDLVEVEGVRYSVDGVPAVWPMGTVARIRRVDG